MSLGDIITIIGTVLGLSGLSFGLYEYYIAQKWKKSEFAANQLALLSSDPELELACKLLDWSSREFPVPEKYQLIFEEKTFIHDWETLRIAMLPESKRGVYNWQQTLYRDIFDHFFNYLENINHSISINLISQKDVESLRYWLKQIASPRFVEQNKKSLFMDFIKEYEYSGVLELMRHFGINSAGKSK